MPDAFASSPRLWKGPRYAEGLNGFRLLVVAQEHEAGGEVQRVGRGLEAGLVGGYVVGTMKHQAYTDLARLVLGRAGTRSECERFWNAVAFANLGPGVRQRTIEQQLTAWSGLEAELEALLGALHPDGLLVLGAELETRLAPRLGERPPPGLRVRYAPHPGRPGFEFRAHLDPLEGFLAGGARPQDNSRQA